MVILLFDWPKHGMLPYSPFFRTIGYTVVDPVFAAVLLLVLTNIGSGQLRFLRWPLFVYTGQIVYGLYLLHRPAGSIARRAFGHLIGTDIPEHSWVSIPLTFVASYIVAALSWRFFELPILALKDLITI